MGKHLDTRAAYLLRMLAKKAPKEEKKEKKKKIKEEKRLKEEKKEKKPKAPQGPVHIGSSDLVIKTSLDPAIFAQCKEKMRNVKKSLKALDKPDPSLSPEEQVSNT